MHSPTNGIVETVSFLVNMFRIKEHMMRTCKNTLTVNWRALRGGVNKSSWNFEEVRKSAQICITGSGRSVRAATVLSQVNCILRELQGNWTTTINIDQGSRRAVTGRIVSITRHGAKFAGSISNYSNVLFMVSWGRRKQINSNYEFWPTTHSVWF